jgi:hypothetical protein
MATVELVPVPEEDLERLLASAGKAVLIGGQALAFWMNHYGVDASGAPEAVVTKDVDFLGEKQDVERLAAAVGGAIEFPKTMSILTGVIRKRITADTEYEVDVLWRVNGVSAGDIRREAKQHALNSHARFFVMSPIECLVSRLENLRTIQNKQTPAGVWQAATAVQVARRHIENMLKNGAEKSAIRAATTILAAATHQMGMNAYKNYGIDALAAVPVDRFSNKSFIQKQWALSVARIEKVRKIARPEAHSGDQP